MKRHRFRAAFTLVELLVVIAIIGIIVSLLLPAVQAAREAARRIHCSGNLSRLMLAVHNYEMAHGVYPSGTRNPNGPVASQPQGYHHNWITLILPYMEHQNTFRHTDFSVGVYHQNNEPVRELTISLLNCPSSLNEGAESNYAGVNHDTEAPIDVTNNGVFFLNSRVTYEDNTDGASRTMFIGEKTSRPDDLGWMSGTRATLRNTGYPLNAASNFDRTDPDEPKKIVFDAGGPVGNAALVVGGFASYHGPGAQFAFGDGSVQFVSESINAVTYRRLAHRADGQLLQAPW